MGMCNRQWQRPLVSLCTVWLLTAANGRPTAAQPSERNLIDAVKQGTSASTVARLLEEGVDVNASEPDGTTALHWAVQADAHDTAQTLITAGARVHTANRYGVTPLVLAATNGSANLVTALLAAGAEPDAATLGGDTPLMIAARTGRVDVIQRLLAAGAAVEATENWKGQTALMWAAAEGNDEAVLTLIAAGADIEARSAGQLSPLHFGVRQGQAAAVSALVSAGADVNVATNDGTSPLVLSVINAHFELAKLLLDRGADPNSADPRGSVLHALAWIRRPGSGRPPLATGTLDSLDLARALLDAGANPNSQLNWREIPFEVDLGIVRPPPGISVGRNFLSFVGATPFYLAAKHADVGLMRLLIEYGADPLTPTRQHITPLMAAAGVGFWDGESPGPLNGTPEQIRLEAVQLAVELGNDIHAATDFGNTQLAGDGRTLLLRHPFNLTALDAQRDRGDMRWGGSTALHGAAMMGSNLVVQYLLNQGADINAENALGWTPLMVAEGVFVANTEKAWPDTVALLLERGASSD